MKDAFSNYHPLVNFAYFGFVFSFTMVFMHPICLIISLISAFTYSVSLKGKKAIKFNLLFLLPTVIMTAVINPAFNHEGVTIITYLHTGNPLTLESIVYGIAAASMLGTVILWFSAYNEVMTSDKFVYLFGRIIPSLSLIISMALRFVPRFKNQITIVANTQRTIGRNISNGTILQRARKGITILSIMVTWALENAIDTADSMKSRGYGLPGRTAFSIYNLDKRDKKALTAILTLGVYILVGGIMGGFKWRYFPSMKGGDMGMFSISLFISYLILCFIPIIVNREEARQWESTQLEV